MYLKIITTWFIIFLHSCLCFTQTMWVQKTNFGGVARNGAVGFSIGAKGYIGTGIDDLGSRKNDFWEWDQTTNTWSQKANFGGTPRNAAVGFSIGTKGYIGTGYDGTYKQDFWEWDGDPASPNYNTWTQKANFGGAARSTSVAFSIGTKGYIGTGRSTVAYKDFWEYNPATNLWTQKANFSGTARYGAVGFSIGTKGYIGTGYDFSIDNQDFYEWNQANDTWTQKTNFPVARRSASGFSIGTKGYMGTGWLGGVLRQEFYEYNPATDIWTQVTNFCNVRDAAVGFSIGTQGYIGTGRTTGGVSTQEFWEFNSSGSSSCTVLPIKLLSFFGNCAQDKITLHWQTASEINNSHFSIERSSSGNDWNEIGKIKGAGNSSAIRNYEFTDNELQTLNFKPETLYYRLKQTDYDGKCEYFGPVSGNLDECNENKITVLPTVSSNGYFTITGKGKADVSVYTSFEQKIFSSKAETLPFTFSLKENSEGVYIIHINSENKTVAKKIINCHE